MKLSIILVNQNMCSPLRQALFALKQAVLNINAEIKVIDNASADRSAAMVKADFPAVQLISNDKSVGLSAAINQGIKASSGDYILVLSPCIITGDDTLEKVLAFADAHVDAGGLSVRMLDAEGNFMADSKRAMPSQWVKFFTLTGLSKIFRRSQLFNKHYNPGWSEEFDNTETDVLNNSFMLLRRSVLKEIGLFDERFKAYGQDMDISYRIKLAGYKNLYFAKTFVIQQMVKPAGQWRWHFIKNFYGAMLIFAAKYLFKLPKLKLKATPRWLAPVYEFKQ